MQVFVPYPSFWKIAKVLDNSRLGNQVYREGLVVMRRRARGPLARAWEGYERALARYCLALLDEMEARGNWQPRVIRRWRRYYSWALKRLPKTGNPPWWGSHAVHSSHRGVLLYKDPDWYSRWGWREDPIPPDEKTGSFGYIWPN